MLTYKIVIVLSRMMLALSMILCGSQHACSAAGISLLIYDLSTGQQANALAGHNRPATAIAVSPDGTLALTASLTPELRLWSLQTGREIRSISQSQLPGYVGAGCSLQFVNGTNLVLVGRYQAGVHLWNLESNALVLAFKPPFMGTSSAVRRLGGAGGPGRLHRNNLGKTERFLRSDPLHEPQQPVTI